MHRATGLASALIILFAASAGGAEFSGASALEFTRKAVSFGPRPPGSDAIKQFQAYLVAQLKTRGCQVEEDNFTAQTPNGPIPMKNVICKFAGSSGRAIVISGHYDTKLFPGRKFVGANDGGASAGLLLELARVLRGETRRDDVYLVWFDGEEAIREWSATDGLHGSRHLAEKWRQDGTLRRIKALINVDMIGDKHLGILQETSSSPSLRRLVWQAASDLGYRAYFLDQSSAVEDDHLPFLRLGVNALDLIDFDYDPWHTDNDTIDKVSSQSLEIVGTVVLEVVRRLER
jgi:Zn-dependent M28 family amino/carboxypeptidase